LSGLLRLGRWWLYHQDKPDLLKDAVLLMGARTRHMIEASSVDLPGADETLRSIRADMLRSYQIIGHALSGLEGQVPNDPTAAHASLGSIEAAVNELARHEQRLVAWRAEGVPTCPRCAWRHPTQTHCERCNVLLLIADPVGTPFPMVTAAPAYEETYRACAAVAGGMAPMSTLSAALDALDAHLRHARQTLSQRGAIAADVEGDLQASANGLARMRTFEQSRALADLNAGWAQLAQAASGLAAALA
jgi:hypothetical protein